MDIGKRLKTLRKSMGLNQTDFGQIFGLKYQSISDIERGIKFPSKTAVEYAKFRFGENFGLDQSGIPREDSKSGPGSTISAEGIVMHGHDFRDKETTLKCFKALCCLDQLDPDIYAHAQKYLDSLLDCALLISNKIRERGGASELRLIE